MTSNSNVAPAQPTQSTSLDLPTSDTKAWMAVFSVAWGAFINVTGEFLPVGLLPAIARDLEVTDGTAGLMITMPGLAAAIAAPVVMIFSGSTNRRTLLWMLTALLAASNLIAALAPTFSVMLIGRVLLGISLGGFWSMAASLAARLVREHHAPRALAIILSGISMGTIVGVPAGVLIASFIGWRGTFGLVGLVAAGVVILQLRVLPSLPTATALRPRHLWDVIQSRPARWGLIVGMLIINAQFCAYTYITPFLQNITHVSQSALSIMLLAYGLAGLAGTFIAGFTTVRNLKATVIFTTSIIAIASLALVLLGVQPGIAAAILVVWGLAFGTLPMCFQLWVVRAVPHAPEAASAVLVTTFQTCIATGAAIGGIAVDHSGTPAAMYLGSALATIATIVICCARQAPAHAPSSAKAPVMAH